MNRAHKTSLALLAVSLLIAACGLLSAGPSATVQQFFRSVEAGKLDDALKLVTRQVREGFGPKLRMMLAAGTEEMKSKGGIKSIDTKEDVTGQVAKVEVTIAYKNRSTEKHSMRLIKEDGEWRVQLQ